MSETLEEQFALRLPAVSPADPQYATQTVDAILDAAQDLDASDVHLVPADDGLHMSWRVDGVLQPVTRFPREVAANIVSRLKVLAGLLTYKTDVPQEGRIRRDDGAVEMRVSTFPTLFGEKGVVRLFVGSGRFRSLGDLNLPSDVEETVQRLLHETSGVLLVSGPAGSGKTTTLYACLRELAQPGHATRSLVSLEDPIEAVVRGASQSQIKGSAGFDYETGLKSLMRQDPDVIMVGEIRDPATAAIVFQASLTGHLVLTSFHAGSAAETVGRLLDMGIEPYQLRSGLLAVVNQRLVRRLCSCARESDDPRHGMGLDVAPVRVPAGCPDCRGTGYHDRSVLAEILCPDRRETGRAILSRSDAQEIERLAVQSGMATRWDRAREAVARGETSPGEVRRVLGFR